MPRGVNDVFHIKNNIAAGLALAALLTIMAACAHNVRSAPDMSAVAAPANIDLTDLKEVTDTPETIKLRIGTGNPVTGKSKSELCQGCHGEEGNSPDPMIPNLAGQYSGYIIKQIQNFQSGLRTHQIMSAIAASVNNNDLPDIAAYFASRTKMKGDGSEGDPAGKNLFLKGDMTRMMVSCVNCHGINGKGKAPRNPVFPVIGGQHKEYIRGQLINFREGDRANSPGGVMNIIAQKLTDTEINALADYISRR
jgi:cytochrome c553